jgi:chemotaxis protein methyltransferase CheR
MTAPSQDTRDRDAGPAGAREFPYTTRDFYRIAAVLKAEAGITLSEVKAPLVYARLVKRVRDLGLESFHSYCALIQTDAGADERKRMTAALTTNVTRFFREPHHFDHLRDQVMPELARHALKGGRVRLWSAGCSSGQEAYSIALTILSVLPEADRLDVKVLATDIDTDMLTRGQAGIYTDAETRPIGEELRDRWFHHRGDGAGRLWGASKALCNLVAFRVLNLNSPWPMRGRFQAVFCRNTVIYFEEPEQRRVWRQMAQLVPPGGTLYVGHSERVSGCDLFEARGLTTYHRVLGREACDA